MIYHSTCHIKFIHCSRTYTIRGLPNPTTYSRSLYMIRWLLNPTIYFLSLTNVHYRRMFQHTILTLTQQNRPLNIEWHHLHSVIFPLPLIRTITDNGTQTIRDVLIQPRERRQIIEYFSEARVYRSGIVNRNYTMLI